MNHFKYYKSRFSKISELKKGEDPSPSTGIFIITDGKLFLEVIISKDLVNISHRQATRHDEAYFGICDQCTMEEFENAYRIAEHNLRQFALQSRKVKYQIQKQNFQHHDNGN